MTAHPLGVHALVFAGSTTDDDVDTIIDNARDAGYDLVEFSLHDAHVLDVARTRAKLEQAGLAVAASRGLSFDADISSEDPQVVARGEALLHDSLEISAGLGATHLAGALYSAFGNFGRPLSARGRDNVVNVLRGLAAEAATRDVTLALEVCNRYETNVVNTAADALRLADDIGAENVVVHLDSYHMNIEENDFGSPIRLLGDRLGYVHIGENHRGYLGSGHLDFTTLFHALADIGYQGALTFESFSSAVASDTLSNELSIWRNLWDDGPALAAHARGFMDNALTSAFARV